MGETDPFENHLTDIAAHVPYPPTPTIPPVSRLVLARSVQAESRRTIPMISAMPVLARAAILILAIGVGLLAVPDIRAAVLSFLRIGALTIYLDGASEGGKPLTLSEISGETPLNEAQSKVRYPLRVPPDSPPDRVFVQDGQMVIMVWINDQNQIEQALYQIPDGDWQVIKSADSIKTTTVNGEHAVWVDVRHPVQILRDGEVIEELTYFVGGNVLVWMGDGITYRLESGLSMDEARVLAASLVLLGSPPGVSTPG